MEQIIRVEEVCAKIKVYRSTLYRWIDAGLFPAPFTLVPGGAAVGWRESDINQWIVKRSGAAMEGHGQQEAA